MHPNKLREVKPSVSVRLITVIAVLVVALVFVACTKNSNQTGNAPQSSTGQPPSSTPTPTPTPKKFLPADTIIVIRDGTVDFEINPTLCEKKTTGSDVVTRYECDGVDLDDVTIMNEKGHEPKRCPKANGNSTVTIDRGDKEIEVKGTSHKVTIKFKTADYSVCYASNPHHYCNNANHLDKVKVDSVEQPCSPVEKCEIWVRK